MIRYDQLDLEGEPVDRETLREVRGNDEQNLVEQYLDDAILQADEIDWDAFCREMGSHRGTYQLPTTPDGERGPWLDRLAVMQDAAMHVRDGGEIDVERVIEE